jgi:hypothetical protein
MSDHSQHILVLVHPGSACGSADYNLGKVNAREARENLIQTLDQWNGALLVIDGELSDELDFYPQFSRSIETALHRAKGLGLIGQRVIGNDPDQVLRITEFVTSMSEQDKADTAFTVTGAWLHPEDGTGCVGSVHQQLLALGCKSQVDDSAVSLFLETEEILTEHASPAQGSSWK